MGWGDRSEQRLRAGHRDERDKFVGIHESPCNQKAAKVVEVQVVNLVSKGHNVTRCHINIGGRSLSR